MIIVGFGHKKRRGKDKAVQFAMAFARQHYPSLKFEVLSFGDQLKKIAYQMFSWAGLQEAVYYENNPSEIEEILPAVGKSARQIWDEVGLMGRQIHPKVWVQMGANSAPEADVLFCKDVRFPTEIELIDMFKGFKYRLDRDVPDGGAVDQALNDYTGWDEIIDNNGSLKDLNRKIKELVATTLNKFMTPDKVICPFCYCKHMAVLLTDVNREQTALYKCKGCGAHYG